MRTTQRVRVHVEGRVQGVFFRASLRDVADELGLAGWVRNMPDGRVEAELQGDADAVGKAVAFCREGPPSAHVTSVDVDEIEPRDGADGFRVR